MLGLSRRYRAAAGLFGIVALCAAATTSLAEEDSTLVIATPADVLSWDPIAHLHSAGMPIYRSIFDSPLIQSFDLELQPYVIESWEWLDEEGKTLEVTLRNDVYFHNGDRLTAEDFRFSYIERPQADDSLAIAGAFRGVFKDIEVVSPTKAIVHFERAMPTVLEWFGSIGNFILPKNYFNEVGKEAFLEAPVGSGPYKLVEHQRGTRVVLQAFEDYWNGRPKHDRVVFEIVREPSARVAAVQSGQVDIANVPIREAERLGAIDGLVSRIEPVSSIVMVHMKHDGVFEDRNVRLAAHHAIDKEAISRAFFAGEAIPISVPGTPSMPGYPHDLEFPHDPDRARDLLAESGYGPDNPAQLTLFATNGVYPNDWEVARAVVGMWRDVGLEATLEPVELTQYYELNHSGKLPEGTLWTWSNATNDPELFAGYMLNPDTRFSVWRTEDMAEKLAPLLSEPDYDTRIAGYADLNQYVIEQGYTIPIVQAVAAVVHKDDIDFTWFENGWYEPYRIGRQ